MNSQRQREKNNILELKICVFMQTHKHFDLKIASTWNSYVLTLLWTLNATKANTLYTLSHVFIRIVILIIVSRLRTKTYSTHINTCVQMISRRSFHRVPIVNRMIAKYLRHAHLLFESHMQLHFKYTLSRFNFRFGIAFRYLNRAPRVLYGTRYPTCLCVRILLQSLLHFQFWIMAGWVGGWARVCKHTD